MLASILGFISSLIIFAVGQYEVFKAIYLANQQHNHKEN